MADALKTEAMTNPVPGTAEADQHGISRSGRTGDCLMFADFSEYKPGEETNIVVITILLS